MKSKLRVYTAVSIAVAGLLLVVPASPGSTAARQASSLSISPRVYVGGQAVTYKGNLGVRGTRNIHLQINMGGSNTWTDLPGTRATTKADGSFSFRHPALSMFGIRVRVAGGGTATPGITSDARSQDLVLDAPSQVSAGQNFKILVDTTPTPQDLPHNPDLPPPPFPGRTLTLQQRVIGQPDDPATWKWQTVGTPTQTDASGNGQFTVTAPNATPAVYRVRQEDWTNHNDGSRIGWFPSFPTSVVVTGASPARATSGSTSSTASRETLSTHRAPPVAARASGSTTASQKYGWRPALWDFAWEFGESLTSRPYRGTDRVGKWVDASNGSGRAAKHNGGLMLDSQREFTGSGDKGTTVATLTGNPMKYGRWEAKLRLKSPEQNTSDYHVKLELVPALAADYHCGGQNITVADLTPHGSTVAVGARSFRANRQWTSRSPIGSLLGPSATFSVEVARGHISWFLNGRVIATVRDQAAVSDVPMTLRFSLVGNGQQEMNRTQAISDWQRGFSLDRGRMVTSGKALQRGSYRGGC